MGENRVDENENRKGGARLSPARAHEGTRLSNGPNTRRQPATGGVLSRLARVADIRTQRNDKSHSA